MSHTDSVPTAATLAALLRDLAGDRPRDPATLFAAFDALAADEPDALAVRDGEIWLTYGEVARRVDELAAALVAHNIGPETTVAVALPRSAELVIAVHAVIAAGGAFVLLDPDTADEVQHRTVALAAPTLILTSYGIAHPDGIPVLYTDATADFTPDELPGPGADNPAYLVVDVHAAAAVVVGHRAAQANSSWRQRLCGIGGGDSVLWHAPLTDQAAVGEMLLALQTGATLVVSPKPSLADAIAETHVTAACFDHRQLAELAALPDAEERLDSLRIVLGSGGPQLAHTAAALRSVSGATLWHVYGRPETAGECVAHEVTGADLDMVPFGSAADDVELLILDEHLRPVADGEIGELYVSGVQLARGYLGRQATAATFLANPIGPVDDRMFATGDLVRRRPPGDAWTPEIEFVGRVDDGPFAEPRVGALPGELLLDEFEAQAAATPFDPAVVHAPTDGPTSIITYGDLDRRTNQLARYLIALGIGPESTVLVDVPRSIEFLVAAYAVLKAGGAVVPIDTANPLLPPMAEPALALTTSGRPATYDVPSVTIDRIPLSTYATDPLTRDEHRAPVLPRHPAFVLFPPGATHSLTISHAAAVHRLTAMQSRHHLTARDVHLHQSHTGEPGTWHGYLLPLRVGATVVLSDPPDPTRLADLLAAHAITTTDFTPYHDLPAGDRLHRTAALAHTRVEGTPTTLAHLATLTGKAPR
ncbi:AMP-binding protein [Nocardia lasii]|uniref:AMP-binding protein n=1 Tax=Nocardia lasii TaxID=1616107 RepID=A0ABW1K0Q4_9NOCA